MGEIMNLEEKIDAYLNGQLSAAERQAFEQQIQQDPQLAEDIRLQEEALQLLRAERQRAYKSQLQEIARRGTSAPKTLVQETPVVALWQRNWVRIAAAVVLLIGLGFIFWPRTSVNADYLQMAQANFTPYPDRIQVRGGDSATSIEQAMLYYNQGDYMDAVQALTMVPVQDTNYLLARFYQANAHIALKQPTQALELLLWLKAQNDQRLAEATDWYLALAYLQNQNPDQAKTLLQEIAQNQGNAYQERAAELLNQW